MSPSRRLASALAAALVLALALALAGPASAALEVGGSSTVNPVVAAAAEALRAERGLEIRVDPAGGSSGGIAALGEGRLDIAMSSRPLDAGDRERFPRARFEPVAIGVDAVAVVVSADVWEAGVRSLSRADLRAIYEGRARSWQVFGGPDRRIAFFNKEPGRGTWEVFARWLYGDPEAAPLISHPEVGSNEETRNKVASTRGAISQLSAAWADGERVFALAIESEAAGTVAPTPAALAAGRYPLARPLYLITDGPPSFAARQLIDFLLGPRGQALVARYGYSKVTPASSPGAP